PARSRRERVRRRRSALAHRGNGDFLAAAAVAAIELVDAHEAHATAAPLGPVEPRGEQRASGHGVESPGEAAALVERGGLLVVLEGNEKARQRRQHHSALTPETLSGSACSTGSPCAPPTSSPQP